MKGTPMIKHRKTIRIICFVLLLVALILKAVLLPDNNFPTSIIYPVPLIAFWLILDHYILKDCSKKVEMKNTKIIRHAKYIYWTIYIFGLVTLEIVRIFKISPSDFIFTFIICGTEFKEEIIARLYKKLSVKKAS